MTQQDQNFDARLKSALKENHMDAETIAKDADDRAASSGLAAGLRIGLEFASGTLVGLGIGYGIDHLAGTKPLFMIIFLFLGFGAGILNVYRVVNNISEGIGINRENVLTKQPKQPTHTHTD